MKLYRRGELVKVHPRQHRGGRATDSDDYPAEKAAYALRAPDRIVHRAGELGRTSNLRHEALRGTAPLESFDWSTPIQVDRRHLNELFSLQFLQKKEHVLFISSVGVGKTFLAQALGAAATRAAHSVLFRRADLLLRELGQARADHSFEAVFRRYLAPDLLVSMTSAFTA